MRSRMMMPLLSGRSDGEVMASIPAPTAFPVSVIPVDTTAPPTEMTAPAAAPATEQPVRPMSKRADPEVNQTETFIQKTLTRMPPIAQKTRRFELPWRCPEREVAAPDRIHRTPASFHRTRLPERATRGQRARFPGRRPQRRQGNPRCRLFLVRSSVRKNPQYR